jgi:hypothetical protein
MGNKNHQIRTAGKMSRFMLASAAVLCAVGLFWGLFGKDARPGAGIVQAVDGSAGPSASPLPTAGATTSMEGQILQAIGKPGARVRNLRIVDQKRQIACGERIDPGSAIPRRFVWLSQLRQLVTDDGGQDFAILINVCMPPPA